MMTRFLLTGPLPFWCFRLSLRSQSISSGHRLSRRAVIAIAAGIPYASGRISAVSTVNERTLRDLEFKQVLAQLRERAASPLGAEAIGHLTPTADLSANQRELSRVGEMMRAVKEEGLSLGPMADLEPVLERARETTSVSGEDFLQILKTLESARRLKGGIDALEQAYQELARIADRIRIFRELEGAIRRSFDGEGELREDASPRLRRLSHRKRTFEDRVEDRLKAFLEAPEYAGLIQEPLVTRRSSRLVIPIKSHAKRDLDCVVHDRSDSGQTLYVEPRVVVEDNNRIRELESEIRDEKIRILRELTEKVQRESGDIRETLRALRILDSLYARARYAHDMGGCVPRLNGEGRVRIMRARHPLLDPETVVPIDLSFGDRYQGALITGPNTGGKTVTLKTVGLFTLMAQSGIPVPAEPESELSVFETVRSDIGDEQSIQQNLSTFSSHMKNIVGILGEIGPRSLALIDELGAGTDPQEGAALGIAIMNRLLEVGARLAVTTHFSALKHFAYQHPGLKTCSVEFDVQTLQPTYRLIEGVGSSNAFIIAERLGLEAEMVSEAKGALSEGAVKAEEIIRLLEQERVALSEERAHLERERREARARQRQYESSLRDLEADVEGELRDELRELRQRVKGTRAELERALASARRGREEEIRAELKRLQRTKGALEAAEERALRPDREGLAPTLESLQEGTRVRVEALGGKVGSVLQVSDEDRIEVDINGLRVEVELEDISLADAEPGEEQARGRRREGRRGASVEVLPAADAGPSPGLNLELDVRGFTVSEALRAVDLYIDRLVVNDVHNAAIIHGKGTGKLRREIRDRLTQDSRVKDFHPAAPHEGGDGATIVELTAQQG